MFRMWAKMWKDARLQRDIVIENASGDNRTKKVFDALDEVCRTFDLAKPIWLDANIREFRRRAGTRFSQDNFTEVIAFDYLEIQMLEEDS